MQSQMRDDTLAVIIASVGRPLTLHETLLSVLRQRLRPGQVVLSVSADEDVRPETRGLPGVSIVRGSLGLTRQRNGAIDALAPAIELVAFIDDDVELHDRYLERVVRVFRERPDVALVDGCVVADGRDIPRARSREIVASTEAAAGPAIREIGPELIYGCNMNVRRSVLAKARFDERLPLYGYMEDRDFAFECARIGRLARCESALLVHLRPSGGRISPRRLGFSQIMNPVYLWQKGNYVSWRNLAWQVSRPLLVNAAFALATRQRAHRLDLLAGNCRAFSSILRGHIAPEDVTRL
jgi:GT2 family glycosyltransferase